MGVVAPMELQFPLEVVDGWPPVAVEGLPCTPTNGAYRVEVAPLFIKDLSAGDVISVTCDSAGHVSSWSHTVRSNRTTIWLLRLAETEQIAEVLGELRSLNCNTTQLPAYGCYSIDVPPECPIGDVDACLAKLDPSLVAIAYPSFRHQDSSAPPEAKADV
jgi:hypothetical protein